MEITAQQIAAYINGVVEGNPDAKVNNFAKIEFFHKKQTRLAASSYFRKSNYIYPTDKKIYFSHVRNNKWRQTYQ